ncbi:MAG: type II secretion system F family protein [Planctomycetota bacterium]
MNGIPDILIPLAAILTPDHLLLLVSGFLAVVLFIMVGVEIFSRGWESYEERYVQGAEKTLDSMFITLPREHIVYLSIAAFAVMTGLGTLASGYIWVGLPAGMAAFAAPPFVLRWMKNRRDAKFGLQLVDALSSIGNALKAGLSLPQALDLIAREMDNPIRQEFRLVTHELKFGIRMEEALGHLRDRMPNPDVELMGTAITISQEVGGNLAEVFENIANTIRERHRVEARIRALTAQGKLQGIILCLVPFALGGFLTAFYPGMMRPLYETGIGWALIGGVLILEAMGAFFIKKIVTIDV